MFRDKSLRPARRLGPAHQIGDDQARIGSNDASASARSVQLAADVVTQMLEVTMAAKQQGRCYAPSQRKHASASQSRNCSGARVGDSVVNSLFNSRIRLNSAQISSSSPRVHAQRSLY